MKLGKSADGITEEELEADLEMVDIEIPNVQDHIHQYAAAHHNSSSYIPLCRGQKFDEVNWTTVISRGNSFNGGTRKGHQRFDPPPTFQKWIGSGWRARMNFSA